MILHCGDWLKCGTPWYSCVPLVCLFPVLSPYFILRRLTRCILFEPYCWTWSQFQAVPCICFAILGCILYPLQYPSVFIWLHGTRSEGSSLTMEVGGVGSFYLNFNCNPTKLCHGGRSQFDLGRVYGSSTTTQSIKKRSLTRAHRRLQLNGCTWYRGQYWQQVTFPKPPDFIADLTTGSTTNHRCQPSEHLPSNRLVFWHWNSGTLSSTRYQELLRYLHLQKVDVALISETHWKYNIEWSTQHWHAIHTCSDLSCSSEKASGLLLLIAKRCCQAHQLSWRAIAPWQISLAFINFLGIPRCLNEIAGNLYGYISETLFRHFHRGISYVFLVTSIAHFQASTGWLVPRTFEPRMVVSLDLNMVTWQPLLAYFKTFNLLPWIVGWLPMVLHSDPLLVTFELILFWRGIVMPTIWLSRLA